MPIEDDYSGLIFAGNICDVNNSIASSPSDLIINNLDGSNASTSCGGTTTINTSVTVTIRGVTEGASVKVIANATVGSVTIGDVLLEALADSNGEASFVHAYEGDLSVIVRVRASGLANAAIAEDGGAFTDETLNANSSTTDDMTLLPAAEAVDDAYYFGHVEQFPGVKPVVSQAAVHESPELEIVWEYRSSGSPEWQALSGVVDNTSDFTVAGENKVTFTIPGDWATDTINGQGPFYFVRARMNSGSTSVQPLGKKCILDVTRYRPFNQIRTIVDTGLTVTASWAVDTVAQF